jgi:hypothetical protein
MSTFVIARLAQRRRVTLNYLEIYERNEAPGAVKSPSSPWRQRCVP